MSCRSDGSTESIFCCGHCGLTDPSFIHPSVLVWKTLSRNYLSFLCYQALKLFSTVFLHAPILTTSRIRSISPFILRTLHSDVLLFPEELARCVFSRRLSFFVLSCLILSTYLLFLFFFSRHPQSPPLSSPSTATATPFSFPKGQGARPRPSIKSISHHLVLPNPSLFTVHCSL